MDADDTASDGKDVREGMSTEKPGQYKRNGMQTRVYLGPTGSGGLQEESNGGRGKFLIEEDN